MARCCGPQGLALTWSRGSASDECASRRSRFELSEAVRAKRDGLGLSFGLPTPRCRRGAATCVRTQILPSSAPANRVHGLQVPHVAWPPRRDGASAPRPSYLYSSGDSPAHGRSRRRNTSPRQDVRVGPTRHIPQSPTRASRCRGSPCPARQPGIRGSTAFFPHGAVMGRDCCGWGRGERSGPAPPAERPPHATATDLACMLLGFVSGRGCLSQQYEQGRKQHSVADRRPGRCRAPHSASYWPSSSVVGLLHRQRRGARTCGYVPGGAAPPRIVLSCAAPHVPRWIVSGRCARDSVRRTNARGWMR